MDCPATNDLIFVSDEKLDFDVSWSSNSSVADEVFMGSVGREEMLAHPSLQSGIKDDVGGVLNSLSPLSVDQLDAVFQEAHKLVDHLQNCEPNTVPLKEEEKHSQTSITSNEDEVFLQDLENKLIKLSQPVSVCSPMKRQTFIVQDSPMKELPPVFQKRILRGSSSTVTPSSRPSKAPRLSSCIVSTSCTQPPPSTRLSTRLSTSSGPGSSTRPAPSTRLSTRLSTSSGPGSSTRPAPSTRLSTRLSTSSGPGSSTRPAPSTRLSTRLSTSSGPGSSTRPAPSTRLATRLSTSSRLSTVSQIGISSPSSTVKSKPAQALREKAMSSVGVVLPNKPSISSKKVERARLQPPSKVALGLNKSPSSRPSSRAPSCEDLLSDSMSVASDMSESSFNSSLGKPARTLPAKGAVNKWSAVKAPHPQTRQMTERRKTSSSSSSVSSFNSSISLSPAPGKVSTSVNRRVSKPALQNRSRRSVTASTAETPSSTGARRPSSILRKTSESEQAKTGRSTPLKRTEVTNLQPLSANRGFEALVPASSQNTRLSKSKPQALVPPTPSGSRKGSSTVEDMLKTKQLVSMSKMQAAPQTGTPAGGCRSPQIKARRPSALPTPLRRGSSSIPLATPTNRTGIKRPLSDPDPSPARKNGIRSPTPAFAEHEESNDVPVIKPFCLEDDAPVTTPSILEPEQSDSTDTDMSSDCSPQPGTNLIQLETKEEGLSKLQEVLLLDLPAPNLHPHEKLLIDLTNTPDLIRTNSKSGTMSQLIDLSSPLIKWSPENKEKNAPLINLSF